MKYNPIVKINFKEKSKLSTWIYRIAYNESIRFLNKESKMKKIELDSKDDNYSRKLFADTFFDANNLSLKFHQILSELSIRQRNIFNMKYFDELKFEEIAKITDININTCLLYTSPSPRDPKTSRMPSSA